MREKLEILPKLPTACIKAEESIKELIKNCITDLQQLEIRLNQHIEKHLNSYRRFDQLRQKLIYGEPLNAGEATGDSVAKMLKEIEETGNLENPYCMPAVEVEEHIVKFRQQMADIKNNIEAMRKPLAPVEFKDQTLTVSDLASLPLMITSISFVNCRSK
jgi:methionyl-tRNA formyltransferase